MPHCKELPYFVGIVIFIPEKKGGCYKCLYIQGGGGLDTGIELQKKFP